MSQGASEWLTLSPTLGEREAELYLMAARALIADPSTEVQPADVGGEALELVAARSLLQDLSRQGWALRVEGEAVQVMRAAQSSGDLMAEKARLRAQELLKRDEQLREPSTRRFIVGLEVARPVSVRDLLRDGRELAARLREADALSGEARAEALSRAVSPYLQVVTPDAVCEHSGLRLQDIWRYFRHTWSNQYTTNPGRTFAFLVRDRAAPRHPVIGIGALGSPIVQLKERDAWIGWRAEDFLERLDQEPTAEVAQWLLSTVEVAISELYLSDFMEEGLLDERGLSQPSAALISSLEDYSDEQRARHQAEVLASHELKRALSEELSTDEEAATLALTALYKSKRAASLAALLRSRLDLSEALSPSPTAEELTALLSTARGRDAVKRVLRKSRGDRVGISVADVTVCGAVAPYTHLLGGKLVSMIAGSPELVARYEERYRGQVSQIASKMAGRAITRSSALALVGTTSLYSVGSSQYNRIKLPTAPLGGRPGEHLSYLNVGRSAAFGTAHLSALTLDALNAAVDEAGGRQVNSIFGEGVSPKLRRVRDGLRALGLPTNPLLQHGRNRIIYMVPLVRNLRRFLLGLDAEPDYLAPPDHEGTTTETLAGWWRERWLSMRIQSEAVLSAIEAHVDAPPMSHGARVPLPPVEEEEGEQLSLFGGL